MTSLRAPAHFEGRFLTEGVPGFEERRRLTDHRYDSVPAAIAECLSVADVQDAVNLARTAGLPVAVRSGGHSFRGLSTVDGGLVIDLSAMRDVYVDRVGRTARVRPGARLWDVARATAGFGLAAVTGTQSTVGFGGLTAVSGRGKMSRRHGHSCDNVLAVEMVTATGEVLSISAVSHPDLFWAVRGAGDSFGVITAFEVMLHPIPETVSCGRFSFAVSDVPSVLKRLAQVDTQLSEDCCWTGLLIALPGMTTQFTVEYTHLGSPEQRERDVAILQTVGQPIKDVHTTCGYLDLFNPARTLPRDTAGAAPASASYTRCYLAGCELPTIDDETVAAVLMDTARQMDSATESERAGRMVQIDTLAFGVSREVVPPSVFPKRPGFSLLSQVYYTDPVHDAAQKSFADGVAQRLIDAGVTRGGMNVGPPNWTSETPPEALREFFGDNSMKRLTLLKDRYDPDDMFRRSIGIRKSGG
ncbi:FAD-binding protein [Gordonia sp. SID5947]|uniref:FAD-dependent oxidoreductase n=1 Tax=Gordonia sp. SID5947 TaxID=2690315 RepID=UPI00136B2BC0|nr:FAD-binding oxidoreductase [Gordonia sp. SID5947]MYR07976.1 FAD-binding protein [Gordonia sp. SID5947]